jgi:hypothetical protein
MAVTGASFRGTIFVQRLFVQNLTEFHENPLRGLVPETILQTDGRTPHITLVLGKTALHVAQK